MYSVLHTSVNKSKYSTINSETVLCHFHFELEVHLTLTWKAVLQGQMTKIVWHEIKTVSNVFSIMTFVGRRSEAGILHCIYLSACPAVCLSFHHKLSSLMASFWCNFIIFQNQDVSLIFHLIVMKLHTCLQNCDTSEGCVSGFCSQRQGHLYYKYMYMHYLLYFRPTSKTILRASVWINLSGHWSKEVTWVGVAMVW